MDNVDYKTSYEDLLNENKLLLTYLHEYHTELEKYSQHLDTIDKCTEKDTYYENIDLKRKVSRQDAIVKSLWESISWLDNEKNYKQYSPRNYFKNMFWFVNISRIFYLFSILSKDFSKIEQYHDKYGIAKTINLIALMPIYGFTLANAWTVLAKHCGQQDKTAALKYSILAWQADPKSFRLKFLAFNMHRCGENEKAFAILESLPLEQPFSDSEIRLKAKIKSLCI